MLGYELIRRISSLAVVAGLGFALLGCDYFRPAHEQGTNDLQTQVEESVATVPDASSFDPNARVRAIPDEVSISSVPAPLAECVSGDVRVLRIARDTEMFAGPFANAVPGDLVLENDQVRVAIIPPSVKPDGRSTGNELIDIVHRKRPVAADYFKVFLTVPDLESTSTEYVWQSYESGTIDKQISFIGTKGVLGSIVQDEHTSPTMMPKADVPVETTWTLYACSNVVEVRTSITNNSTEDLSLLPGDIVSPGEGQTFVEGLGFVSSGVETKASWALSTVDDTSIGYVNYTSSTLEGIFTADVWHIRQYGEGPIDSPYFSKKKIDADASQTAAKPLPSTVVSPQSAEVVAPDSAQIEPEQIRSVIDQIRARQAAPAPVPPTETQTEPKGGAGYGDVAESDVPTTGTRLVLRPGESYEYSRALVMSDSDMARISYERLRRHQIRQSNALVGMVLEVGTSLAIPNADVLIAGGPGWDGKGEASPYLLTRANIQGVYAVQLPEGKYIALASQNGRLPASESPVITVRAGAEMRTQSLVLSPISIASVGVADGDIAVNTGLPSKLTIETREAFKPFEFPFAGEAEGGVRNVIYMPDGAARFPLTPGKYRFTISRGPEYERLQEDVEIEAGAGLKKIYRLNKALRPEGMVSVDACIQTTASATSMLTPQSAVVMAACEGVDVIVSGDYGVATDLQPYVEAYGLASRLKAMQGMRMLVGGYNEVKADLWVFPLTAENTPALSNFYKANSLSVADLYISKLRTTFPNLYIQVNDPLEARKGYLAKADFSPITLTYDENTIPPPDFDGLNLIVKASRSYFSEMWQRYGDLQDKRTKTPGAPVLSPVGFSMSDSPIGSEIGYPRMYMRTSVGLANLTDAAVASVLKRQRYIFSTGPIIYSAWLNPETSRYDKFPGSVVDLSTTNAMRLKLRIDAAPWVDISDFNVYLNGRTMQSVSIKPGDTVERWPDPNVQRNEATGRISRPLYGTDHFSETVAMSWRRSLSPVVSTRVQFNNEEVWPLAWTGSTFLDENGDAQIGGYAYAFDDAGSTDTMSPETQKAMSDYFD